MAEFKFHCPECGQKIQTTDDMVGHSVDCPICRKQFKVPPPPPADAPQEIPCALCRALIPRDSMFCDVCGGRQPAPGAGAAPVLPGKLRARRLVWGLSLAALAVAAALVSVVIAMTGRRPQHPDDTGGAAVIEPPSAAVAVTAMGDAAESPADDYPVTVVAAPPAPAPVEPPPYLPPEPAAAQPPPPPSPPPSPAPAPSPAPEETNAAPESETDAADEVVALFERTREKYKEVLGEIEQAYRERVIQVQTGFLGSLEKQENAMQEKGDLMGVLAVRKEREAFQGISEFPPVIRSAGSTYAEVAELKKKYNQQLETLKQDRDQNIVLRTGQYDKRLAEFERRLTQAGKIDEALSVHAERERVRSQGGRWN